MEERDANVGDGDGEGEGEGREEVSANPSLFPRVKLNTNTAVKQTIVFSFWIEKN